MKLLVIGSGGREHALAWRLAQSSNVQTVFVAPGNGGTACDIRLQNLPITNLEELANFAQENAIHLTVVGPEAPLSEGIVDLFRKRGLRIFGPTKLAAQLESSKDFAKAFMIRHDIPTATYQTFTDATHAHAYLEEKGAPIVIKADGLAAGKGVVVATTLEEAHQAVDMMLLDNKMGNAGARVVIEEFLQGEEASFIVICDGKDALPMATSQDHKRLLDNDQGPNTGGMGAYSPAPVVTPDIHAKIMREVIYPCLKGMATEGLPYTGFLYAGLMISPNGNIKVLEFNCRMGDPETQPIVMRLKSDLVTLLDHAVNGQVLNQEPQWDQRAALGVVIAAANYPETPRKNDLITLPQTSAEDAKIFHAGTRLENEQVLTNGGRVLCVTALGNNIKAAQKRAYELVAQTHFEGLQYRKDIGHLAIKRKA